MIVGWMAFVSVAVASAEMAPDERALVTQVDEGQFIKARGLAETILAKRPDSFAANWALARIFHDAEGNHARALYYVQEAGKLLDPTDVGWGRKVLLEEYSIYQEMANNSKALDILDTFSARYGPAPAGLRVWPLLKDGRVEEARTVAMKLIESKDRQDRADGYNGLLTIAFEERDRQGSYDWAVAAVAATSGESCTILRNAGASAFNAFKIDEAEEYLLKSNEQQDCVDPVGSQLASFYLQVGEFQKAVGALRTALTQPIERRYRPQFASSRRIALSDLLVVLGREDEAEAVTKELFGAQARTGMTSSAIEIERLARVLRYALAVDGKLTRERERASYAPRWQGLKSLVTEVPQLLLRTWELRQQVRQLLVADDRLSLILRPQIGELSDWSAWRIPDLIPIVGAGVFRAALARARIADAAFPQAVAHLDALEAAVAHSRGDWAEAVRLASSAVLALSHRDNLVRWRTMAVLADSYAHLGRLNDARELYQGVLQNWPTILRLLDVRLPMQVLSVDEEIRARLERSRRFELIPAAPFSIIVESFGKGFSICLRDDRGVQYACGRGETADAALTAFHDEAFSPKISLSQSDVQSLDGSPTRVGTQEVLKQVLGP